MILVKGMKELIGIYAHIIKQHLDVLFGIVAAFLLPVKGIILAVIVIVVVDLITGLLRAKKNKEQITSRRLSNTASKLLLYLGGVLLFFVMEKYLVGDVVKLFVDMDYFLTKCLAIFFSAVELLSIKENTEVVFNFKYWEFFKKLLNRSKMIKDEIKEVIKDDDKKNEGAE